MNIYELRQLADREEIDYLFIMDILQNYAEPRKKIQGWLETGELIRIKKGLYVFGPTVARRLYSQELLANLIYGPSAISLEYALAHYGLIPEKVTTVTCVTCQRNKIFSTPVGVFSYRYLPMKKYQLGITQQFITEQCPILIASPEKALVDKVYFSKLSIHNTQQMMTYLVEDLRIDEVDLHTLDRTLIQELTEIYAHQNVKILYRTLKG